MGSPEDTRGRLHGKETAFHKAGIVCAKTLRLEGKESQCTKSREKWEFDGSGLSVGEGKPTYASV